MELIFLSHCVPNPPDKGEKIRAFHEINALAAHHDVHLVCFAREASELDAADKLRDRCASVYVAPLYPFGLHVGRAGLGFLLGSSLNTEFYSSGKLQAYVNRLAEERKIDGAVAYSAVMAPYVPDPTPFILDMLDVDSEKWFQYAEQRQPPQFFRMEAQRVRKLELAQARRARLSLFTTHAEESLFHSIAGQCPTGFMENGVDLEFFDPSATPDDPALAARQYVVFVGTLDYFPNATAVRQFAEGAFQQMRAANPGLEFLVVGRNPARQVKSAASLPGVSVIGGVPDVRPYLKHAEAMVAPLGIARGIQNKVLEALAMGKPVLASQAIARTFGPHLPAGVIECPSTGEYCSGLPLARNLASARRIREEAATRFTWMSNLRILVNAVDDLQTPSTAN